MDAFIQGIEAITPAWKEILQYYYKNVEICRWNKGDYPEISE